MGVKDVWSRRLWNLKRQKTSDIAEGQEASHTIKGDEPIASADEDVLGRAKPASVIAGGIQSIGPPGTAVGILGPWDQAGLLC